MKLDFGFRCYEFRTDLQIHELWRDWAIREQTGPWRWCRQEVRPQMLRSLGLLWPATTVEIFRTAHNGGEEGIRTVDRGYLVLRLSKPLARFDPANGKASTALDGQKSVSANQYKPSSCTASSGVDFP